MKRVPPKGRRVHNKNQKDRLEKAISKFEEMMRADKKRSVKK